MLKAKPYTDAPIIKGIITPQTGKLLGRIVRTIPEIKGTIHRDIFELKGTITDDIKREAYYEVSNEYGTTIIIGD